MLNINNTNGLRKLHLQPHFLRCIKSVIIHCYTVPRVIKYDLTCGFPCKNNKGSDWQWGTIRASKLIIPARNIINRRLFKQGLKKFSSDCVFLFQKTAFFKKNIQGFDNKVCQLLSYRKRVSSYRVKNYCKRRILYSFSESLLDVVSRTQLSLNRCSCEIQSSLGRGIACHWFMINTLTTDHMG